MSRIGGPDHPGNPAPLSCDELHEVAPDLALDLLDGSSRAAALAHVERCASCRAELSQLTEAASQVLLAAPEVSPPAGFELRVLERLGLAPTPPAPSPRRWRVGRPHAVLAAAVALLAALVGGGLLVRSGGSDPETTTAIMRTSGGAVAGEVVVDHTDPPVIDVDLGTWVSTWDNYSETVEGPLWLTVETGDGQDTFLLTSGVPTAGTANAEVTLQGADPDDIRSVAIKDDAGRVWCTATFE